MSELDVSYCQLHLQPQSFSRAVRKSVTEGLQKILQVELLEA